MTSTNRACPDLETVLLDFATDDFPLSGRLQLFTHRFPAFAEQLRAVAYELAVLETVDAPTSLSASESASVAKHASRLATSIGTTAESRDVLADLTASKIRGILRTMHLSSPFFDKVRLRAIDVATIPAAFITWLARTMNVLEQDLRKSLSLPPIIFAPGQLLVDKGEHHLQSFDAALESSALSTDQKAFIRETLARIEEGGWDGDEIIS